MDVRPKEAFASAHIPGSINIPLGPNLPLVPHPQQLSPAALCAIQNKDFFNNQCLNKCPAGLEHKQPNGACGPINVQLQLVPTLAQCTAQNRDLVAGKCVDKCKEDEVRNNNGMCVDKPRPGGGGRGGG